MNEYRHSSHIGNSRNVQLVSAGFPSEKSSASETSECVSPAGVFAVSKCKESEQSVPERGTCSQMEVQTAVLSSSNRQLATVSEGQRRLQYHRRTQSAQ